MGGTLINAALVKGDNSLMTNHTAQGKCVCSLQVCVVLAYILEDIVWSVLLVV